MASTTVHQTTLQYRYRYQCIFISDNVSIIHKLVFVLASISALEPTAVNHMALAVLLLTLFAFEIRNHTLLRELDVCLVSVSSCLVM